MNATSAATANKTDDARGTTTAMMLNPVKWCKINWSSKLFKTENGQLSSGLIKMGFHINRV